MINFLNSVGFFDTYNLIFLGLSLVIAICLIVMSNMAINVFLNGKGTKTFFAQISAVCLSFIFISSAGIVFLFNSL